MKAIVEFNLPEDKEDFDIYNKSHEMLASFLELDTYLRNAIKYNDDIPEHQKEVYVKIRQEMNDILQNNDVRIW